MVHSFCPFFETFFKNAGARETLHVTYTTIRIALGWRTDTEVSPESKPQALWGGK